MTKVIYKVNYLLWKTKTCLSYTVNAMAANDLAMEGARASAAAVLT